MNLNTINTTIHNLNKHDQNWQEEIEKYNLDKIDPEQYFIRDSIAQKDLLAGKVKLPIQWAEYSDVYRNGINKEGMRSDQLFYKATKTDDEFAWKLYELKIIDITTDVLFNCCKIINDTTLRIAKDMLARHKNIPQGYWKRSISSCLNALLLHPFSVEISEVAKALVREGGNINELNNGSHVIQILIKRYSKFPDLFTPQKLEMMFECGLDPKCSFSTLASTSNLPNLIDMFLLFTHGVDIDDYIAMLQLIKKYSS